MSQSRRFKREQARKMLSSKIVSETATEIIYVSYYNGHPIHFTKDKATGEVMANLDDMARAHGLPDASEWLGSDAGLDAISAVQKANPGKTIIKHN